MAGTWPSPGKPEIYMQNNFLESYPIYFISL